MREFFNLSTSAKRFRFIAVTEALTWVGLLVGMFFKHVTQTTEIGVKIFGPIHGLAFALFVVIALATARELRWSWQVTGLALLSSIPPVGTVVFEWWAVRKGHLAELSKRYLGSKTPTESVPVP
ncbi:integral membrane protein [Hoyosella altamirensis]|uniref:Integral membrane protein n=2 Tax=Hoyosella altamirensis TaxID=616997 RepID=A0A839RJ31_9ACTN|nr:integral membrane protein [Hoyosella altamirensis]